MGIKNLVVAPKSMGQGGKQQKTDRRDSGELTDALDRYLRGQDKVSSVVGARAALFSPFGRRKASKLQCPAIKSRGFAVSPKRPIVAKQPELLGGRGGPSCKLTPRPD